MENLSNEEKTHVIYAPFIASTAVLFGDAVLGLEGSATYQQCWGLGQGSGNGQLKKHGGLKVAVTDLELG